MLAQMKDKSGRVKIAGFYDDVRDLTEAERAEWKKLPFDEKKYRKEWGAPKLAGESGYTVLERVWGRPTFEVNGLLSGFTGEGPKTVLPAVAMAKVSMRLVPNQDPDKIAKLFEEYVRKIAPPTVELKLTRLHGGKPWMAEFDSPYIRAAGRAIEKGFGKTPVFTREGGSIPVVATFQEELGIPSVLFGVGLPDENAHAPNEKLDLGNFHGGVIASAHLYEEIAKLRCVSMLDVMDRLERFYGPLPLPPEDPFALYVWDVLGVRTTPARRDAAMSALAADSGADPGLDGQGRAREARKSRRPCRTRTARSVFARSPPASTCSSAIAIFPKNSAATSTRRREALALLPHLTAISGQWLLLFAGRHPLLPDDPHVQRVLARLRDATPTPRPRSLAAC